jgi:hypothetical protein
MDHIENTTSYNSSAVACVPIAADMCLLSCYLAADDIFWLHYSGFNLSTEFEM